MKKISILTFAILCLAIGVGKAQYTVLHNFNDTEGANPYGSLIMSGNKLFGMTRGGGVGKYGCIFSLNNNGTGFKDLLDFKISNGSTPSGDLTLMRNRLYGMTYFGGIYGYGCLFSIDTTGNGYKDLHDFNFAPSDGFYPYGSVIIAGNMIYGMASNGGAWGAGIVFSIDTNGTQFKIIHNFIMADTSGALPDGLLLLLGKTLFGMTFTEGKFGFGCVFSLDTNGSRYKDLLDFSGTNGKNPWGSVINNGSKLYGMTEFGGINNYGFVFSLDTDGTGYKDLLDMNYINGSGPQGNLILSGNVLFGMTNNCPPNGGNIFSIRTDGSAFKDHYDFDCSTGCVPFGSLILSGKYLYGMTERGGTIDSGVVFRFDTNFTVSINNLSAPIGLISLFPNPSTGSFTLSLSNINEKCNVEIYNVIGECVLTQILRSTQDDNLIEFNQPNGVYFYRVVNEEGGLVGSGKVVIEK